MSAWQSGEDLVFSRLTFLDCVRAARRAAPLAVLVYGGLIAFYAARLVELPFGRRISPHVTQFVCKNALWILGVKYVVTGAPMRGAGAIVSNHVGWLDIFALNGGQRVFFISKSEVRGWFGIGILARATGTVFIRRKVSEARKHADVVGERFKRGHKLLFFPEGTSSDGRRVLKFKSTLFAPFFREGVREHARIQPVTLTYLAPPGKDQRFYGWWGDSEFLEHFLSVLAAREQGSVEVRLHEPLRVADFEDRKSLALEAERIVRGGLRLG